MDDAGYGTQTVVFPGNLTVKVLDVAYVPDLAFNLFLLMTAHKQGVGFTTEEENFCHVTEVAQQMGLNYHTLQTIVILLCFYHSSSCSS